MPQPMDTIWINVYQTCSSTTLYRGTVVPAALSLKYNQNVCGQTDDRVQRRAAENNI